MFTNTAYEALYEYLGLQLHASFVEFITSQRVFGSVILLIFGVMFFVTTSQFFSRYLPGVLVQRRMIPLSRYVKMVACLFLGISLLKVGSTTSVKDYKGTSWHGNGYIKANDSSIKEDYRVSLLFDVLSRSAEEITSLLNQMIDGIFAKTNSQLEAPNFFYKAVMLAGASTLDDPALRESIEVYTSECIEKILPLVGTAEARDNLHPFFSIQTRAPEVDRQLAQVDIGKSGQPYTCLDAKKEMHDRLRNYASQSNADIRDKIEANSPFLSKGVYENYQMSASLARLYHDKNETWTGIQRGAQPLGGSARLYQNLNRVFSWDGIVGIFGSKYQGASLAAERSQEFSENLSRAPHVAGFIKMGLIAIFPWLVFVIVAGHWRVVIYWYGAYFSVLLWAPIWTLLYHIMTGVSLSTEAVAALGDLGHGVSLYSAELLTTRMNYMFAVYAWLQLLVGVSFSGTVLWFLKPILSDSRTEEAPDFIGDAKSTARTVAKGAL